MNNCTAIGIYKAGSLEAFSYSGSIEVDFFINLFKKALRRWHKESLTSFYDEDGMLVCVYPNKTLFIVICTAEDSIIVNRMLFSKIEKLLKDSDFKITLDLMTQMDRFIIGDLNQKVPFHNKNGMEAMDLPAEKTENNTEMICDLLKNRRNEIEIFDIIYGQLKFEFLKDQPVREFALVETEPARTIEEKAYEQFLVNLENWDNKPKKESGVRISINLKERSSNTNSNVHLLSLPRIKHSTSFDIIDQPKARLVLEEKLVLKIFETLIKEKFLQGKVILSNFMTDCQFTITSLSPEWHQPEKIEKRKFAAIEEFPHSENIDSFTMKIPFDFEGQYLPIYEYLINPFLISNNTIPFYIAYKKQHETILIKLFFNNQFSPHINSLKLDFEFSETIQETNIESSLPGNLYKGFFTILLTENEFLKESALITLSILNSNASVTKITAISVVSKNVIDFDFSLKSPMEICGYPIERRLDVEYVLTV